MGVVSNPSRVWTVTPHTTVNTLQTLSLTLVYYSNIVVVAIVDGRGCITLEIIRTDYVYTKFAGHYLKVSHHCHVCNYWLMSINNSSYTIYRHVYNVSIKFYMPSYNCTLVIAVKQKAKWRSLHGCHDDVLQSSKNYLNKKSHISWKSITTHHFTTPIALLLLQTHMFISPPCCYYWLRFLDIKM